MTHVKNSAIHLPKLPAAAFSSDLFISHAITFEARRKCRKRKEVR